MTTANAPSRTNSLPDGWEMRMGLDTLPPTIRFITPDAPGGMDPHDSRVPARVREGARRAIAGETVAQLANGIDGDARQIAALAVVRKRVRELEDIMEALAPVDAGDPTDAGPSAAARFAAAAVNALGDANSALDNLIDELAARDRAD